MTKILVCVALVLAGCASSVLIAPDDQTFLSAQQHFAATAAAVDREQPPTDERWLFLQAEGLYRYRFEPPKRGFLPYLAQGAAAVIDFPALQSLAASLDLADLRLRMYDGSIQLWETLLQRRPQSRLRPLILYRLGWAYRSAGAAGLPRESGDQAFDALITEFPQTPLATAARAAKGTPWKSKDTATGLSLLPGLGQIYVGEKMNGALRLAVAVVSLAAIVVPIYVAYDRRSDLSWRRDWPLLAIGGGGLIMLSIDYTAAYQDALRGVVQFNEKSENEFAARHPEAP